MYLRLEFMGGTASMQNRRRVDADGKATAGGLGSLSKCLGVYVIEWDSA